MNTPPRKTPGQIAFEAHNKSRTDWIGQTDWDHQCESNRAAFEAAAAAVLASQWQPGPRPDFTRCFTQHGANDERYWMPIPPLPPEHIDPYAAFEKARAEGKVIQLWFGENHWVDVLEQSIRHSPADRLRVKPWTLSNYIPGFRPLEDGEEWHAQNQWVEEFLPAGYRPLLNGELWIAGDEMKTGNKWRVAGKCSLDILDTPATDVTSNCRTRRPLPSTKQELEREEFEGWWGQEPSASTQDLAWAAWQAARNSKHARTS